MICFAPVMVAELSMPPAPLDTLIEPALIFCSMPRPPPEMLAKFELPAIPPLAPPVTAIFWLAAIVWLAIVVIKARFPLPSVPPVTDRARYAGGGDRLPLRPDDVGEARGAGGPYVDRFGAAGGGGERLGPGRNHHRIPADAVDVDTRTVADRNGLVGARTLSRQLRETAAERLNVDAAARNRNVLAASGSAKHCNLSALPADRQRLRVDGLCAVREHERGLRAAGGHAQTARDIEIHRAAGNVVGNGEIRACAGRRDIQRSTCADESAHAHRAGVGEGRATQRRDPGDVQRAAVVEREVGAGRRGRAVERGQLVRPGQARATARGRGEPVGKDEAVRAFADVRGAEADVIQGANDGGLGGAVELDVAARGDGNVAAGVAVRPGADARADVVGMDVLIAQPGDQGVVGRAATAGDEADVTGAGVDELIAAAQGGDQRARRGRIAGRRSLQRDPGGGHALRAGPVLEDAGIAAAAGNVRGAAEHIEQPRHADDLAAAERAVDDLRHARAA